MYQTDTNAYKGEVHSDVTVGGSLKSNRSSKTKTQGNLRVKPHPQRKWLNR